MFTWRDYTAGIAIFSFIFRVTLPLLTLSKELLSSIKLKCLVTSQVSNLLSGIKIHGTPPIQSVVQPTIVCPEFHTFALQTILTTEMLARPIEGVAPALHTACLSWQTDMAAMRLDGRVAPLTSDRPFPQAENATSQKKVNETVTQKSWRNKNTGKITLTHSTTALANHSKVMDAQGSKHVEYPLP